MPIASLALAACSGTDQSPLLQRGHGMWQRYNETNIKTRNYDERMGTSFCSRGHRGNSCGTSAMDFDAGSPGCAKPVVHVVEAVVTALVSEVFGVQNFLQWSVVGVIFRGHDEHRHFHLLTP